MSETLHPLQRFYRAHLARYSVARKLKPLVLWAWFSGRHARHVMSWQLHQNLHALNFALSRVLYRVSRSFERLAYQARAQLAFMIHRARANSAYRLRSFHQATHSSIRNATNATLAAAADAIKRDVSFSGAKNPISLLSKSLRAYIWATEGLARKTESLAQRLEEPGEASYRFYTMVSLAELADAGRIERFEVAPSELLTVEMPTVLPQRFSGFLRSEPWQFVVPEINAYQVQEVEVVGKSDFLYGGSDCIHHGLYKFDRDLPAEEMHGMIRINSKRRQVTRYQVSKKDLGRIDEAILLTGSASANYVHWLTETAPKLPVIDSIEGLAHLPLIIDSDLHPNILESIRRLNKFARPLISLNRGQALKVGRLLLASPVAYVPFDFRPGFSVERNPIDPGFAMFSPSALRLLRESLLPQVDSYANCDGTRLFVRRNSQFRLMQNADQVESILIELGFRVIEPEQLSFIDQVAAFRRARTIVAQAGAALGNIIFAPQDCHVIMLSTWSPYGIYYYFSNIASILGQRSTLILCDPEEKDDAHRAHKGVSVDVDELREVVRNG